MASAHAQTTVNLQIANTADDGYEEGAGTAWSETSCYIGYWSAGEQPGFRFQAVNVPPGSNIISATLQVRALAVSGSVTSVHMRIYGHAADSAPAWTFNTLLPSNMPKTTAYVDWNPSAWVADSWYTVDVAVIVQELVNRPGWAANNAISLGIVNNGTTGQNELQCYDYTNAAAGTAKLNITYGASTSTDQTAFRWRDDDGTESSATWLAAQGTNLTRPLDTNARLRLQLDTAGSLGAQPFRLEYCKDAGCSNWSAVPLVPQSSVTSTITQRGTPVKANGTSSCTGTAPAGVVNNDVLYAFVTDHPASNAGSATAAPTGWTNVAVIGTNSTGRFQVFRCVMGAASCSGTSWSFTGLTTRSECVLTAYYNVNVVTPEDVAVSGRMNAGGTTGTTSITPVTSGAMIVGAFTAFASGSTWSGQATATSPGALTERYDGANSTYCSISLADALQPAATATGASSAGMGTSGANGALLLALRPVVTVTSNPVYVAASANIAPAAATPTTPQLSIPNAHAFTAGRISDDTNPLPALTVADTNYSELEWALRATAPAADADIYRFRLTLNGTPLANYTGGYPQWTVGTPGAPSTRRKVRGGWQ